MISSTFSMTETIKLGKKNSNNNNFHYRINRQKVTSILFLYPVNTTALLQIPEFTEFSAVSSSQLFLEKNFCILDKHSQRKVKDIGHINKAKEVCKFTMRRLAGIEEVSGATGGTSVEAITGVASSPPPCFLAASHFTLTLQVHFISSPLRKQNIHQ
jgi:hypothetical protein